MQLPIPAVQDEFDTIPLSYAQQRQWFLWKFDPSSSAYNIPTALRLKGVLDSEALEAAFNQLIARHQSLRTTFVEEGEQPQQRIAQQQALRLQHSALPANLQGAEQEAWIKAFVESETQQPFDLASGPLLRVCLLQVAQDEHVLVLTVHHIVADGWSMPVMVEELIQLYAAQREGRDAELAVLPIQYADYAIWQRSWMEAGERERQLAYWTAQLGDEQPVLELPSDRPRPAVQSLRGATLAVPLAEHLSAGLKQLAQQQGVTPFMLLLASFQTLLHRYSGQNDIRVGVPIANRNRVETERLIGFFVNTQILRARFDQQPTFSALLQQVKQASLDAQVYQDLPFDQLVEALHPERSMSHNPLFQVLFNYQRDAGRGATSQNLAGLQVEGLGWENNTAQFDLTLDVVETEGGLNASLSYATDLFDASTVERMAGHWLNLLQAVVSQPQLAVGELPMLDASEMTHTLRAWNQTTTHYPNPLPVHQLFEEQAALKPESIALLFGEQQLTYDQLNRRTNQLAHKLIELGVGPEVMVGIAAERSLDMVIGLMAILKAGGAYVPLDPEYPQDRLSYMFEDSGIDLLLTQEPLLSGLPVFGGQTLLLEADVSTYSDANPQIEVLAENLAYVIYTSGSTGKPKGAGNRHIALHNRLAWMQEAYPLDASDTVLQKTPFSFDVSVWEFFWPLMTGARLAIAAPGEHREPEKLIATIQRHQVTTLHFVPSMLQVFIHEPGVERCTHLKQIMCSGEALQVDAQLQVFARLPAAQLYNLYGPTEAAIDVTHWTCVDEGLDSVPIGQPIANLYTHILDTSLNPVPQGATGELVLGGLGLARGYHRRPALTAERFIPDPFAEVPGSRLYRTGDLSSYRATGVIEYKGRIDHQVKIRGLRIELGEIEARLLEQETVRETVVLALEGVGGLQLVGYVVPNVFSADADVQAALREDLKAKLKENLPDYMVPAHLLFLENLPVTPNGKLDRRALPAPDASQLQQAYIAPQSELEQRIASIWQDVLRLEKVGITDNFFELGGDSIISIQVVSRARQAGIRFTPKELFQHQTVCSLAAVARLDDVASTTDSSPLEGELGLLPIQRWFFEEDIPERHHWNQSILLRPTELIDAKLCEQALDEVLKHHDALRQTFNERPSGWRTEYGVMPKYADSSPESSAFWHTDAIDLTELEQWGVRAQSSLRLGDGPLLRVVLMGLKDGSQRLLLVAHHLVIDGVSWRILLEDLRTAYLQLSEKIPVRLPFKTSSVKDWSLQIQAYADSEVLQQELDYWKEQSSDVIQDLPDVNVQGAPLCEQAVSVYTVLSQDLTQKLLQQAPSAYRTQVNDLLLTALARVISRWTGTSSVLLQLEGHGREELFKDADLTRTIGWFTSMFPVKLTPAETIGCSIKEIKEQLRAIPNKGIGYGILRYLGNADTQQMLSALATPRITFNYLGQFDSSFDEKTSLFLPSGEQRGSERSPKSPLGNWLSLNGEVFGGQLSMGWTFSAQMFARECIKKLADEYAQELEFLIEHCISIESPGVTPSDFPLAGLTQGQLDTLPFACNNIQDIYPLSPMQQGILFHSLSENAEGSYINQMRMDVEGLNCEAMIMAWQASLNSHDILRTAFLWQGGLERPVQCVHRDVDLPFVELDWRSREDVKAHLDCLADEQKSKGFDLLAPPLLRVAAVRIEDDRFHLIYTFHHILMDGWSNSQLQGELLQRYAGQSPVPQSLHYRDYIAWLQDRDPRISERFWKEQLASLQAPTYLSGALSDSASADATSYGNVFKIIDPVLTKRLGEFARQQRVTLNTMVQAAWCLLLQRYTGQQTVAFGATVAGRPTELDGIEQQVGLFINTLPVISTPLPEYQIGDWLRSLQELNLELREHEHTPLFEIQRWAGLSGGALFDTLLVFENYPLSEALEKGAPKGLRFSNVGSHEQNSYPLTLLVDLGDVLSLHFSYAKSLLSNASVQAIGTHLQMLLLSFVEQSQECLGSLNMMAHSERQRILHDWNAEEEGGNYPQCIHHLIEKQAALNPDVTALIDGQEVVSYRQLNEAANRLTYRLHELGVGPEVCVGVALQRNTNMVVALLAVLKSGGAYVPLDPNYPAQRLSHMIQDSRAQVLLTDNSSLSALPEFAGNLVLVGESLECEHGSIENPQSGCTPQNLAYVIYTSGSTGKPKGVAITHDNVAALVRWTQETYKKEQMRGVLASTSICFDLSVWELFVTLACGGYFVLARNALELPDLPARDEVCLINTVPSAASALLSNHQIPTSVKTINLAGEPLRQNLVDRLYAETSITQVNDLYGPSEDTTYSTHARRERGGQANIGRPLLATQSYILSLDFQPAPLMTASELYLSGAGVTRGYLGQPALTALRYLPNPYGKPGSRLYRTGDLTRYDADGVIQYVGRIDHQVKVRGFRIELGEIESHLLSLSEVKDAVVIALDTPSGAQLVAYIVASETVVTDTQEEVSLRREVVRSNLKQHLPDFMQPTHLLFLEQLPQTPNGKLDRKALPRPDEVAMNIYLAPRTVLEQRIADLWGAILGVEKIGVNDHFFELGGHSLLVTQLVSRLQLEFGLNPGMQLVFQFPLLGQFVEQLEKKSESLNVEKLNTLHLLFDELEEI
ncbi:amino acid adenylation domain-containing protein [Pseudomonas morbosilactucae]|uniref:amino acid adenylation domain-containing protein n=1 Tax=Pseudomonas morbosilactucae TaxID=2938197 RepID=UPI003CC60BA1